ncbi:MAG: transaldolase family protein, partial [Butyricicoccaceae bacterium]
IHDMFRNNGLKTQVLAASFKNTQQVLALAEYGVGAATVGTAVIEGLIKNACVTSAVDAFIADFEALVGPGKTMLDG